MLRQEEGRLPAECPAADSAPGAVPFASVIVAALPSPYEVSEYLDDADTL